MAVGLVRRGVLLMTVAMVSACGASTPPSSPGSQSTASSTTMSLPPATPTAAPSPSLLSVNVVVATIPLSGQPLVVVFAPDGTPWVGRAETGSSAVEIDAATNTTKREVPADIGLAAVSGADSLWFGSSSALTRVDPVSAQVTATIDTGSQANAVAFGEGAIWTTDYASHALLRVDPATNAITGRIGVVEFPGTIAVGAGRIWVAGSGGVIDSVDPSTGNVDGTVTELPGITDMAFAGDTLYVIGSEGDDHWIVRVDPGTLTVTARASLKDAGYHIVAGDGALWVSLTSRNIVARVDPATLATTASIPIGGQPQGLGAAQGAVWVTTYDQPSLVRIATGQ